MQVFHTSFTCLCTQTGSCNSFFVQPGRVVEFFSTLFFRILFFFAMLRDDRETIFLAMYVQVGNAWMLMGKKLHLVYQRYFYVCGGARTWVSVGIDR